MWFDKRANRLYINKGHSYRDVTHWFVKSHFKVSPPSECWGFLSNIGRSLPYDMKHLEETLFVSSTPLETGEMTDFWFFNSTLCIY